MRIVDQIDARAFNGLGRCIEKLKIVQGLHATLVSGMEYASDDLWVHPMFDEYWVVVVEDEDLYEEHDV